MLRTLPPARPVRLWRIHAASALLLLACAAAGPRGEQRAQAAQDGPVTVGYTIAVPEPSRNQVTVTMAIPAGPDPLRIQMSRSSPGRYAAHNFATNVSDESAVDTDGRPLQFTRDLDRWVVQRRGGAVRFTYTVSGTTVDGTHLGVDRTHAHMNIPATLAWVPGLESAPMHVRLVPPPGSDWRVATQLFPTDDPLRFTAPNLAYLVDSPIEFGETSITAFRVPRQEDGPHVEFRLALHQSPAEIDAAALVRDARRLVLEEREVFGELPPYETGTYTVIADTVSGARIDGMEHRNSTVITNGSASATLLLESLAHELFHGWNVERIRPRSLEPFDLTRTNVSSELWLAEGFSEYDGPLSLVRAGLMTPDDFLSILGRTIESLRNTPAREWGSVEAMSRLAIVTDTGLPIHRGTLDKPVFSYYAWGAAIACALDLALRDRTNGKRSLDDVMRGLWREFGALEGPAPGLVRRPYTRNDVVRMVAEVSGSRQFADAFFSRYVSGRAVPDFETLFARAGFRLDRERIRAVERAGGTLTPQEETFRRGWLESKVPVTVGPY